jgi:putative acetyltransferase
MKSDAYPLRPFLPADTLALRELYAQSIEELTADDYDTEQRLAWISAAEDAAAFAEKLGAMLTLIVEVDGQHAGFASLKDNKVFDMLYVHPHFAFQGVGSALANAIERLAEARGAPEITVEASDNAERFFEARGYEGLQRNVVPREDMWLSNTTMRKRFGAAAKAKT